jgi:iron complex outermembrane receptor protein
VDNNSVLQAGLRFDNRKIVSNGTMGEEGFKAVDKSLTALTLPCYKMDLADDLIVRLNLASGFRAPNLAELTSNGVHEGTNRYEIGNSDLKTEQNVQSDIRIQ